MGNISEKFHLAVSPKIPVMLFLSFSHYCKKTIGSSSSNKLSATGFTFRFPTPTIHPAPILLRKESTHEFVHKLQTLATIPLFIPNSISDNLPIGGVVIGLLILLTIALLYTLNKQRRYKKALDRALLQVDQQSRIALENARNYMEIFNSTNEAIFLHDAQTGNILDVNNSVLKMYGYSSKNEVMNLSIADISDISGRFTLEEALNQIETAIKKGSNIFEWRAKRKDGSLFWVEVSLKSTLIGGKGRVLAVVRDISKKLNQKRALETSEKKFRDLTEMLPLIVWEANLNNQFTYTNRKGLTLFGYTQDEIDNGISIFDIIAPEDHEKLAENIKKLAQTNINSGEEYTAIKKDGTRFPIEVHASIIKENGKCRGLRGVLIDITEKKNAELTLLESEERYRTIVENINEVLMMVDRKNRIQFVNRRFSEKLGYSIDEIIGKIGFETLLQANNRTDIPSSAKTDNQTLSEQYEVTLIAKNGNKVDFMVNNTPIYDHTGEHTGSIYAMVDITEKKRAEKAYRETQQLFETLASMSPVGIFRTDANGSTTYVNLKWSEISGIPSEEALGDGWLKGVHPEDREELERGWKEKSHKQEPSFAQYRFIKPDGTVVWVLGNAIPEITDGKFMGYIGTITDITELKKIQCELERSEHKFHEMADMLPLTIWEVDLEGKVTYTNHQGYLTMGYSGNELEKGVNILDTIVPEERKRALNNINRRINNAIASIGEEYTVIRKDGSTFPCMVYTSQITEEGEIVGVRGVSVDITEIKETHKRLEEYKNNLKMLVKLRTEELETANEELIATNEELFSQKEELQKALMNLQKAQNQLVISEKLSSLGMLAAGVAHEINNPLNFIQGGIIALENYFTEKLKNHKENVLPLIEAIKEGVRRSTEIVRSLNRYSRSDSNTQSDIDIRSIIDSCLVLLNNQIKNRITVHKHYSGTALSFRGNEGQIHQVFMNLLVNAIHAIDDKGRIDITTEKHNNKLKITISDNGCGIAPELIDRITDPFVTTKEPGKGTGLGLSISLNIIQQHGGNIKFESEPGKGTAVIVTLPLTKPSNR